MLSDYLLFFDGNDILYFKVYCFCCLVKYWGVIKICIFVGNESSVVIFED